MIQPTIFWRSIAGYPSRAGPKPADDGDGDRERHGRRDERGERPPAKPPLAASRSDCGKQLPPLFGSEIRARARNMGTRIPKKLKLVCHAVSLPFVSAGAQSSWAPAEVANDRRAR